MRGKKPKMKYGSVLLIDDNDIDNFINQKVIESVNFAEHIFTFTSGKGALDFIQNINHSSDNNLKALFPDIIFLDINMPMMDGYQFIKEMKDLSINRCKKCSIAMLTSSMNPGDIKHSYSYKNVVAFISKPLTPANLEEL